MLSSPVQPMRPTRVIHVRMPANVAGDDTIVWWLDVLWMGVAG